MALASSALRKTQLQRTVPSWLCLTDKPQPFQYFAIAKPALQALTTVVICSASHTKPIRCPIFSFVLKVLGREGTLSTLLVNDNLNIKVKQ